MKFGTITDVGRVRKINEDTYKVFAGSDYSYAIVADGMGGHLAGEIASEMSVNKIAEYINEHMNTELDKFQVKEVMRQAFMYANKEIYEYSCSNESVMGMGTTSTLCMIYDNNLIFAHVGDSRAYKIFDSLEQITRDHSFVQELVKLGQITPEEAKHHPRRNYITRAMGVEREVKVDTGVLEYRGERILLCSDGLFNDLDDAELFETAKDGDLQDCVERLVKLANERGGNDNITAVLMEGSND